MKEKLVFMTRFFCGIVLVMGLMSVFPQFSWAQEESSPIQVELGFGTGIDRETRGLTGQSETFAAGIERVFCRMHITGATAPTTVNHVWYRDGKTMAQVELNVGSANWRTWSSKRLLPSWTGFWEVKVLDQTGKVLASASFEIN